MLDGEVNHAGATGPLATWFIQTNLNGSIFLYTQAHKCVGSNFRHSITYHLSQRESKFIWRKKLVFWDEGRHVGR